MKIKVKLCALSDPVSSNSPETLRMIAELDKAGIEADADLCLNTLDPQAKADAVNQAFKEESCDWIFDISGGNLANTTIPYLDYQAISKSSVHFAGFSDLSSVLNAMVKKAGKTVFLFPLWYQQNFQMTADFIQNKNQNCSSPKTVLQTRDFPDLRQTKLIGGNIRCFMKLAGTEYFPDTENKVIILEGMSTGQYELISLLAQLKQTGSLNGCKGLLFGVFSKIYSNISSFQELADLYNNILEMLDIRIPFEVTLEIGHIPDSKGVWLS